MNSPEHNVALALQETKGKMARMLEARENVLQRLELREIFSDIDKVVNN